MSKAKRYSVQVSRLSRGEPAMFAYSSHDSREAAEASAKVFLKKYRTAEVLLYDAQTGKVKELRPLAQSNPYSTLRAEVRRLPSGQVQIRVPLKRGENPHAKAQQVARMLGRKVTSVSRVGGGRVANPTTNTFSIGGPGRKVSRKYVIGTTREGWWDVEPVSRRGLLDVRYEATVKVPHVYVGSSSDFKRYIRDEILSHYGLRA